MTETEIFDRADAELHSLCHGSRRWTMRIPAEPERDSDLVIGAALEAGRKAAEERDALRAKLETTRDALRRAEARLLCRDRIASRVGVAAHASAPWSFRDPYEPNEKRMSP